MDKIVENLADDYVSKNTTGNETYEHGLRNGFLAGYEMAMKQILDKESKTAE